MAVISVISDVGRREVQQISNVLMLGESDVAGGRVGVDSKTENFIDAGGVGDGVTFAQGRKKVWNQMLVDVVNKYAEVIDVDRKPNM